MSLCPLLFDGFNLNVNSPLIIRWQAAANNQGSRYFISHPMKGEILTYVLFPQDKKRTCPRDSTTPFTDQR